MYACGRMATKQTENDKWKQGLVCRGLLKMCCMICFTVWALDTVTLYQMVRPALYMWV